MNNPVIQVAEKIESGFYQTIQLPTKEVCDYPFIQVRKSDLNWEKVYEIANHLRAHGNYNSLFRPICIIVIDGIKYVFDGNHSKHAAKEAGFDFVPCLVVPYEDLENERENVQALGLRMNASPLNKDLSADEDIKDYIRVIAEADNNGKGQYISSQMFREHIQAITMRTAQSCAKLISSVKNSLIDKDDVLLEDEVLKDKNLTLVTHNQTQINAIKDQVRKRKLREQNEEVIVSQTNTAAFESQLGRLIGQMTRAWIENGKKKRPKAVIIMHREALGKKHPKIEKAQKDLQNHIDFLSLTSEIEIQTLTEYRKRIQF